MTVKIAPLVTFETTLAEVLPAAPPAQVLAAMDAAAHRGAATAAAGRQLNFELDEHGRLKPIEVRDRDGAVLRTMAPSQALGLMSGLIEPY